MKNSQYVNQVNVNISEMARLVFNEYFQHDNDSNHVVTVSMHINFLKVLHNTIGDALNKYAESIENMHSNKKMN